MSNSDKQVGSPPASHDGIIATAIFAGLLAIYLSNRAYMWSGDGYPASAFVLNLIYFKTIYFEKLCPLVFGETIPYFFRRNLSGHILSSYPIGSTVFYLPFHAGPGLIEWAGIGACDPAISISHFTACRLFNDKLTSAVAAALQGMLFWRLTRYYLASSCIRLLSTVFFAIGTDAFVVTAQTNFQHGPTIALLLLAWLLVMRIQTREQEARVAQNAGNQLALGLILGFMVSVRPSNVLFVPALVWPLWHSRAILRDGTFMLIGGAIGGFGVYWNLANFGNLLGGIYGAVAAKLFVFSISQLVVGFLGLTVSPSHGLFVFTPVCAVTILGLIFGKRSSRRDATMWLLLASSAAVFAMYCFYSQWSSGWAFGPRYLIDVVPIWIMSAAIDVENCLTGERTRRSTWILGSFVLLGLIGIMNQFAGAFGANGTYAGYQWDFYSYDDDIDARLWRLDDSPLRRDYLAIFNKLRWRNAFYGRGVDGVACLLQEAADPARITVRVLEDGRVRVKAFAVNLGHQPWIGVRGGAPLPPTLVYGDGTADRYFVLADAFVAPGAVGTFRDFSEGAATVTGTSDPIRVKGFLIGGSARPLGCS